jgi:NAD(P)-dependent dehydrogenase (short-subunit alcohol dehydrogenase family)
MDAPKTVLITGATDGIGLAIAQQLVTNGVKVIVHGRSDERLAHAAASLGETSDQVATTCGDFSSLAGVDAVAAGVSVAMTALHSHTLDAVIHNAAAFFADHALTVDGIERTWMINHVAPFLLTHRLSSLLRASKARVVLISALGHIKASLPQDPNVVVGYDGQQRYMASKLANVMFAQTLARLFGGELTANSMHPGVVTTKLLRAAYNMEGRDAVTDAAARATWLAVDVEAASATGAFFVRGKPAAMHTHANDIELQDRLWEQTEELCRL